jgi:hypothetical protein
MSISRWKAFPWCAVWLLSTIWSGRVGGAQLVSGPECEWTAPDRATIRWATDVPTRGRVQYGLQADQLTWREEGPVTNRHAVLLGGLQSGSRYFFVVGTARQRLSTNSFVAGNKTAVEALKPPSLANSPASTLQPAKMTAPPSRETWRNLASLRDHFDRHGGDFGAQTPEEYARLAWEFLQRARAEGLPAKVDEDGVLRVFEPRTRIFAAYNRDGTTKTFFKPGSRDYFERQPGRSVNLKTLKTK